MGRNGSLANKRSWKDPKVRIRRIAGMRAALNKPDIKKKHVAAIRRAVRTRGESWRKHIARSNRRKWRRELSRKNAERMWREGELGEKSIRKGCETKSKLKFKRKIAHYWETVSDEKRQERLYKAFKNAKNRPNKLEKKVKDLSRGCYFRYVGDGKLVIGGRNPDFANKSRRKIVEVDGDYWHKKLKEQDVVRVRKLRKLGYDVLVVREHDVNKNPDIVRARLLAFAGEDHGRHSAH